MEDVDRDCKENEQLFGSTRVPCRYAGKGKRCYGEMRFCLDRHGSNERKGCFRGNKKRPFRRTFKVTEPKGKRERGRNCAER